MPTDESLWSFPKIAEHTAREQHGEKWPAFIDKCFGKLAADYVRGLLPPVFLHPMNRAEMARLVKPPQEPPEVKRGGKKVKRGKMAQRDPGVKRELIWRLLGAARPPAFDDIMEGECPDWDELARSLATSPEDWGQGQQNPGLRNTVLTQLMMRPDDARARIKQHSKPRGRVGAPEKYNWESFWREVVTRAQTPDGLPPNQADLVKQMLNWFEKAGGQRPGPSTIRAKLSRLPYYNR